jgi:molybdopterin/thiamine biosynthesis adenylyltransferase
MIEVTFSEAAFSALRSDLLGAETERCALALAQEHLRADGLKRLLVRTVEFPAPSDYTRIGPVEAELKPEVVAWYAKRARRDDCSLIFAHSHPGSEPPRFSITDDRGEGRLAAFLGVRAPGRTHASLVLSEGGVRGRALGAGEEIRVTALGDRRSILFDPTALQNDLVDSTFDRQVRAFGVRAQHILQDLHVAIVGLGGTGSLVCEQLVHLGVREFTLIDPDTIEVTNLNRLAGAAMSDIGSPKVDVAAQSIQRVASNAQVHVHRADVTQTPAARTLTGVDLIFGCTDSHGSRAVLQQVAYQYLIPLIDMGVVIVARPPEISHAYGRVQLLAPSRPCFTCSSLLNPEQVRRDMLSDEERRADPYIVGEVDPAPAVMSINGTVASLSVTMALAVVADIPSRGRSLLYNALASTLRSVGGIPDPHCYICSQEGSLARGDSWPLFAREAAL